MCLLFHKWDNNDCRWPSFSASLEPENKERTCLKCGKKQEWIQNPLPVAFMTDQSWGFWQDQLLIGK